MAISKKSSVFDEGETGFGTAMLDFVTGKSGGGGVKSFKTLTK